MVDLFDTRKPEREPRRKSRKAPVKSWDSFVPAAHTSRGMPYAEPQGTEDMVYVVAGEPDGSREHRLFVDVFSAALADERLALRVFSMSGTCPNRVRGALHCSDRAMETARRIIATGERRDRLRPLPFVGSFPKGLGKSSAHDGALHHGFLHIKAGMRMAFVTGAASRLVAAQSWPVLGGAEPSPCGAPLVLGGSTARASWRLLAQYGAIGVWEPESVRLWLFKVVEEAPFPSPLDELRRRAAGQ